MIAQSWPWLFNFDIHITIFGLIGEFGYKRCLIVEIRCLNMVFPPEEIGMLLRKDLHLFAVIRISVDRPINLK